MPGRRSEHGFSSTAILTFCHNSSSSAVPFLFDFALSQHEWKLLCHPSDETPRESMKPRCPQILPFIVLETVLDVFWGPMQHYSSVISWLKSKWP